MRIKRPARVIDKINHLVAWGAVVAVGLALAMVVQWVVSGDDIQDFCYLYDTGDGLFPVPPFEEGVRCTPRPSAAFYVGLLALPLFIPSFLACLFMRTVWRRLRPTRHRRATRV